jgi:chromosome segregation ATPase
MCCLQQWNIADQKEEEPQDSAVIKSYKATTDQSLKQGVVVDQREEALKNCRRENEMLRCQVKNLMEQVRTKDDEIMVQMNHKVQNLKNTLSEKDERILDLQEQINRMREHLVAASMESEKASVAMLTTVLEKRDKQIEELQNRLVEVVVIQNQNAALIEEVNSRLKKGECCTGDPSVKITVLQNTLHLHETHLKDADKRALKVEEKQHSEIVEMSQYDRGFMACQELWLKSNLKKSVDVKAAVDTVVLGDDATPSVVDVPLVIAPKHRTAVDRGVSYV